jgi:hypothetical protein
MAVNVMQKKSLEFFWRLSCWQWFVLTLDEVLTLFVSRWLFFVISEKNCYNTPNENTFQGQFFGTSRKQSLAFVLKDSVMNWH